MNNGTSVFNKMGHIERSTIGRISEEQGTIEERAEKMMDRAKMEIEGHEEAKKYKPRAEELLREYGTSNDIPQEELEKSPGGVFIDGAKLLAYAIILEEKERAKRSKLH